MSALLGPDIRRYKVWFVDDDRTPVDLTAVVAAGRSTVRVTALIVDDAGRQSTQLWAAAGSVVAPERLADAAAAAQAGTPPAPPAVSVATKPVPAVATAPTPGGITRSYVVIERLAGVPFQYPGRLRPMEAHRKLVLVRCLPGSAPVQIGLATRTNNDSQGPTSGWQWTLQPGQELALTENNDQVYLRAAAAGSPPIRVGVYTELRNA